MEKPKSEGEETEATGACCGDQRRLLAAADVDALERVVLAADDVERAPEPARAVLRGPDDAAAPVAARVEVRLVGVGVVDGRQHGDLAGVVELAQAAEARVPAEAGRARERQRRGRVDADARAQLGVARIACRHERVEAVVAAVEVERDEDRRVRGRGRLGDGGLEHAARREPGHAVGREQQPDAAGQQITAREAAALELREAVERALGDRDDAAALAAQRGVRAVPVVAGARHQQTCASGPASSTWRSTRSRSG